METNKVIRIKGCLLLLKHNIIFKTITSTVLFLKLHLCSLTRLILCMYCVCMFTYKPPIWNTNQFSCAWLYESFKCWRRNNCRRVWVSLAARGYRLPESCLGTYMSVIEKISIHLELRALSDFITDIIEIRVDSHCIFFYI